MKIEASTVEEYLEKIPEQDKETFEELRNVILENLPSGFEECLTYGMIGYVVPQTIYPSGYHCDQSKPLPFLNIAVQKNFIAFYHMGIYADPDLLEWFVNEYPKHCKRKLDMGKSCIRFKKMVDIPYMLIGELVKKVSVKQQINQYEEALKKQKKKTWVSSL